MLDPSPITDDSSGVVVKEVIEEIEGVLFLGGFGEIGRPPSGQVRFIETQKRIEPKRDVWQNRWNPACLPRARPRVQCVVFSHIDLALVYGTRDHI